jgi:hypothetical protein
MYIINVQLVYVLFGVDEMCGKVWRSDLPVLYPRPEGGAESGSMEVVESGADVDNVASDPVGLSYAHVGHLGGVFPQFFK